MADEKAAPAAGYSIMTQLFVCIAYIGVSASLINLNKYIVLVFPFPLELAASHMLGSWSFCFLLYLVSPGLFPSMERACGKPTHLLKCLIPIGACFATSLACGTTAYIYCSVAFLQFMKESNIVLVFMLSCAVGLQSLDRVKSCIVLWILAGSCICVRGEIHFILIGFLLQVAAQLAECIKNVAGEFVLSGSDLKLDPLTYILCMSPIALFFLCVGIMFTWNPLVVVAYQQNLSLLLPSICLAIALNIIIAMVLKNCSTMGFTLAGLLKDMIIVSVSAVAFGDPITTTQMCGFAVTLSGVGAWSLIKLHPQGTLALSLEAMLGLHKDGAQSLLERVPLVLKEKEIA